MPNVRIEASGDVALQVEVRLGPSLRDSLSIPAGDSAELVVGGNQIISIKEAPRVEERNKTKSWQETQRERRQKSIEAAKEEEAAREPIDEAEFEPLTEQLDLFEDKL